jgi:predicted SnoaL-like aldol condensation-catalyzing enzyme
MKFEPHRLQQMIRASIVGLALVGSAMTQAADAVGEANKKTVLAFYEAALVKKDVNTAVSYLGTKYIQHNPTAPDGVEGVKGLIKFLAEKFPNRSSNIVRVVADADLVVLHVHAKSNPEDRGTAIVDIFRLENGKIVEHWDVMQPVPEKAANSNTMF